MPQAAGGPTKTCNTRKSSSRSHGSQLTTFGDSRSAAQPKTLPALPLARLRRQAIGEGALADVLGYARELQVAEPHAQLAGYQQLHVCTHVGKGFLGRRPLCCICKGPTVREATVFESSLTCQQTRARRPQVSQRTAHKQASWLDSACPGLHAPGGRCHGCRAVICSLLKEMVRSRPAEGRRTAPA